MKLFTLILTLGLSLAAPVWAQEAPSTADNRETNAEQAEKDPLVAEADRLKSKVSSLVEDRKRLEKRLRGTSGNDQLILERQIWQRQVEINAALRGLAKNTLRQEKEQRDVAAVKRDITRQVERGLDAIIKTIENVNKRLVKLRQKRDAAQGSELMTTEGEITLEEQRLQDIYLMGVDKLVLLEQLSTDTRDRREKLKTKVSERADALSGRLEIFRQELRDTLARLADDPENSDLKNILQSIEQGVERNTTLLTATVALMGKLDMERTRYQQLLLEATGQITVDVLDTKVALGLLSRWWKQIKAKIISDGPSWLVRLIFVVITLLLFRVLAGITSRVVSRSVRSSRVKASRLLKETLVSWSSRVVMLLGVLVALSQVGVEVGPFLTGLGIAGLVIGFALQDSLSNFAAGAMILFYSPFDEGDVIEAAGIVGKVSRLTMASTTILTFDNQTLIVPNKKIWGDVIRNITAQKTRRVDLVFSVAYSDDLDKVESVLWDILGKDERLLEDPKPLIKLHTLGESSVDFIVRPWCLMENYWDVYWDLTRAVKVRFDQEGITIPFPQREVHVSQQSLSVVSPQNSREVAVG